MRMILQDPYSSLNPRLKVRDITSRCWKRHLILIRRRVVTARDCSVRSRVHSRRPPVVCSARIARTIEECAVFVSNVMEITPGQAKACIRDDILSSVC